MPLRFWGAPAATLLAILAVLLMSVAPASATIEPAPGGPILLVTTGSDPFSSYYTEILRNEGYDEFATTDVSAFSAGSLAGHDTVILGSVALTPTQVSTLTAWVQGGGNLIAMRPDKQLAPLLGLADAGSTLSNANMTIDGSQAPGAGITSSPLQFHGTADLYNLAGARAVATLSPGGNPAVSLRDVGAGRAASFTYDLARSVVYTRQGNPAWAGQNRDQFATNNPDPVARSNDLFFGNSLLDPQADWVDLSRVAIPQADEQQRLLANLLVQGSLTPLPHFWYFPRGDKAVLAMTGDDHGSGGTNGVFDTLLSKGPAGCQPPVSQAMVDAWQCPRATSYIYPDNTPIDATTGKNWNSYGFELAAHPLFQSDGSCVDFTWTTLNATLTSELAIFHQKFPDIPASATTRTHCISWSDWASQPKADVAHGIRLNTDYYYFPAIWTHNVPGMFTGSGMPMRFADTDGSLIDAYQATTYAADDATRVNGDITDPATNPNTVIPNEAITLMSNALGANGYYGAFTIQVHSDEPADAPGRDAVVDWAMAHGVPVITERQLLTWLDGRNSSQFQNVGFGADGTLSFTIAPGSGANGLQAMLPINGRTGAIKALTRGGAPVAYDTQTIKGVAYAVFPATAGSYAATYPPPPPAPRAAGPGGGNSGASSAAKSVKAVEVLSRRVSAPTFPRLRLSAHSFRVGSGRSFAITLRLARTSRLVLTFRNAKGKAVRQIRVARKKAGTVLRLRWDGKDSRGRYVKSGTYRFTLTAVGTRYHKTARGSVKVLKRK
jgi:FlgD Ig-like domain